jgi:hypothetical protein
MNSFTQTILENWWTSQDLQKVKVLVSIRDHDHSIPIPQVRMVRVRKSCGIQLAWTLCNYMSKVPLTATNITMVTKTFLTHDE